MRSTLETPRSTMDRDGVMRWRCSQCSVFRLESDMVWGFRGGGSEKWPTWRVVCKHCTPAPAPAPVASKLSPRRVQLSPRRLVPLTTARADLNARSASTRAAARGGSLAAAAALRPPEPRQSRDPQRHALVSRFRCDGPHARAKPLGTPGVNSRLRALSTANHSTRSRGDSSADAKDDDEPPPGGYHPQIFFAPKLERNMLKDLLRSTNMTRTELYRLFNRFKALCQLSGTPGSINKKTFKEGVSSLAFEDDAFVDRVFQLLDDDGSGTVEWEEFVNTVNALETGSPYDKLAFCFQVYDTDGNNSIEREELHKMFTSMLQAGMPADDADMSEELKELIDDFVNSIYDSIDCDRSGSLEFDEVAEVIEKLKITDVWEIFGRTLVSSV